MKTYLVLYILIVGLSGCTSLQQTPTAKSAELQLEPLLLSYAAMGTAAQYECLVSELQAVGAALQAYARAHNGQLPPRLTDLVQQAYLPASGLISSADPTCGSEGGVPNRYSEWGQAAETDETGSSYLYEFSGAPCKWEWKSYLGGNPKMTDIDTNQDGIISWNEAKNWQLLHGDGVQKPHSQPYPPSRFPIVRCYWYQYPDAYTNATGRTVLNLAADLRTVFVSQPWWEKDQ